MIIGIANIIGCKNSSGGNVPPSNTIPPSLSGSSIIGSTLTCSDGTWNGTLPISFTYQWKRNGSDIIGETASTYVLVNADYANSITCEVTATNSAGISSALSDVIIGTAIAPSATVDPVISGTNVVGQTLSCTDGSWSGTPVISYTYQWKQNGSDISGATSSTYVLVQADAANTITCVVTGTNVAGSSSATSSNSFVILDANAYALLTATAITDATITAATNTFCIDLKANNLYTKMKAVYLFIGSTATTHKYNLIDPQDTDAAFRLVFNGGWTHSANGATPNGINAYADTKFNPTTHLTNASAHFAKYNRTLDISGNKVEGALDSGNSSFFQQNYSVANGLIGEVAAVASYIQTDSRGLFTVSRTATNAQNVLRNSTQVATSSVTITNIPNKFLYIGARHDASPAGYNLYETAFASYGNGLSNSEIATLYTIVQNFQIALSRQV